MVQIKLYDSAGTRSPSTRRAWIEMAIKIYLSMILQVALHPEGVDRNRADNGGDFSAGRRPPPGGRG